MADMGSIKLLSPVRATKRVQGVLQGAVKVSCGCSVVADCDVKWLLIILSSQYAILSYISPGRPPCRNCLMWLALPGNPCNKTLHPALTLPCCVVHPGVDARASLCTHSNSIRYTRQRGAHAGSHQLLLHGQCCISARAISNQEQGMC